MKKREPVSHIMTKNVVTVNVSDSLDVAERVLRKNHIRHIPVVDDHKLVGMLSLTDLLRVSFVDSYGEEEGAVDAAVFNMLTVPQIMVSNPKSIREDQTIKEVAEVLASEEYHALPVVDAQGDLVGIATTTDLIKYLLEQY